MPSRRIRADRRRVVTGLFATAAVAGLASRASARPAPAGDLDALMRAQPLPGTFAHLDTRTDRLSLADGTRAARRYSPASTFKIANALIALETGAIADEHEVLRWNGEPQPFKPWEQDMALGEAIRVSNVPAFQAIARRVGLAAYEHWLERLGYGNAAVGDRVDRFWLDGPLAISAIEQAGFLAALALGELPMSKRSQEIVRRLLLVETSDARKLYAKTGWSKASSPQIGWWVGWVESGTRIDTFALNADMAGYQDAPKRVEIGKAMLAHLGLW